MASAETSNELPLEVGLECPPCPGCGTSRIRPTEIQHQHTRLSDHSFAYAETLQFACRSATCNWQGFATLPAIKRRLVYLDTYVYSKIAIAQNVSGRDDCWTRLYGLLREATEDCVIFCPGSDLTKSELDLTRRVMLSADSASSSPQTCRAAALEVMHNLGRSILLDPAEARIAQSIRALERYLAGAPNVLELRPPLKDFDVGPIHAWTPGDYRGTDCRYLPPDLQSRVHESKARTATDITTIFGESESRGLTTEELYVREKVGHKRAIRHDRQLHSALVHQAAAWHDNDYARARSVVTAFSASDHACTTPFADLRARLFAGLAERASQKHGARRILRSDPQDVEHLATFAPYVDLIVTDSFAVTLASLSIVQLPTRYGVDVRALRTEEDVDNFEATINTWRNNAAHLHLARRVKSTIDAGGYRQEQAQRLIESLRRFRVSKG